MTSHTNNELRIRVVEAKDLKAADLGGTSDPFIECRIMSMQPSKDKAVKTKAILKTTSPRWDEVIGPLHPKDLKDDTLEVKVYDHNTISTNELIGIVDISVATVAKSPGGHVDDWWEFHNPSNKSMKGKGSVHLVLDLLIDGKPPVSAVPLPLPPPPPAAAATVAPVSLPPFFVGPGPAAPVPGFAPPPPHPPPVAQTFIQPGVGFVQQPVAVAPDPRPPCRYGATCYRKNPSHFQEFSHPAGHPGPGSQ